MLKNEIENKMENTSFDTKDFETPEIHEVIEKKKVVKKENVKKSIAEKYEVCVECKYFLKKEKICIKLDCKQCKGKIVSWLHTEGNYCPEKNW